MSRAMNAPIDAAAVETIDDLYAKANGDCTHLSWHTDGPCPALVAWLNVEASALVRPGATAAVIGCGLGDDVAELGCRGYDVTGFDVSPSAIDWARRRHPSDADRLVTADLLRLPVRMLRRFDLVVEAYTLEWIDPSRRQEAAAAIVSLARPHGSVIAIAHGRDDDDSVPSEPPFPLSPLELTTLFAAQDMHTTRQVDDFLDDDGRRHIRGCFHH